MADMSVILGTGPLGVAIAGQLVDRGEPVRVVNRKGVARVPSEVEVIGADLADPEQAGRACADARVVYHCASPPYHRWAELHPPLMAAAIEGASAAGATLVFGDNLYAYGPPDGPLTEDLPYRAAGPNGRARIAIAETLMAAHRNGRVQAAIGRGSDFFGRHVRMSAVGEQVFGRAVAGKPAQVLGNPDIPHSVTYIDDFAQALITLAGDDRALGGVWHVPCAPEVPMRRFVEMVFEQVGNPARLRVAPGWGLTIAGLFNPTVRAVREQLYQHQQPWVVDSSKFERTFGWTATPLADAIHDTVAWFTDQAERTQGQD
jgi:nucleoside-diphosphate-sugar epimerase